MADPRNLVSLAVGVVADPEVKHIGDTQLVEFRFAIDRAMRDSTDKEAGQKTAFINGTLFNSGDFYSKFVMSQIEAGNIKKGSQMLVLGSLAFNAYNNKDGIRIERPYIRITSMSYQGGGRSDSASGEKSNAAPAETNGSTIVQF